MDVRNDTAASDGCLDEGIKLFITSDGKLQVARSNAFHLFAIITFHWYRDCYYLPSNPWMHFRPILTLLQSSILLYY